MFNLALGTEMWASLPDEARAVFVSGGPALLAEIRGRGLDLSADPFAPSEEQLARVRRPTLVLSGEESYPAARDVDDRLVAVLPDARHHVVAGGHVIDPAHPALLEFLAAVLGHGPAESPAAAPDCSVGASSGSTAGASGEAPEYAWLDQSPAR